jgi:hypothetical protein
MSFVQPSARVAFSAWRFATVLNGAMALALAGLWVWMCAEGLFWRADFSAFYTGYTLILDGRGDRLYDLDRQAEYQAYLLPERPAGEGLLPFVHPPHAAVALTPLGLLSRPAAFALWSALQVGMCVLACRFLLRLQVDQDAAARWVTIATVLAFPPLFSSFQMGQVSLWCLVCQLGFVCALKDRRPLGIAAWIVAGSIKPQLMVMPCMLLLALRRWRELAWLASFFAVIAGLATLVLGPRCWLDYLDLLRVHARHFGTSGVDPLIMYNVKGLLTSLLGQGRAELINQVTVGAWLASLVFIAWLWRGRRRLDGTDWRGKLALSFLVGILVNPHLNPMDALTLVLPAVLFHAQLISDGRRQQAAAFAAVAVCCPLLFLIDCWGLNPSRLGFRPFIVLMLAVLVWILLSTTDTGKTNAPSPTNARA